MVNKTENDKIMSNHPEQLMQREKSKVEKMADSEAETWPSQERRKQMIVENIDIEKII